MMTNSAIVKSAFKGLAQSKEYFIFSLLFAVFAFNSMAQSNASKSEIKAFVSAFEKSYNDADATKVAGHFSTDATMLRSDGTKVDGRKAIEGYYAQFFSSMKAHANIDIEEVLSLTGNYNYTSGAYQIGVTFKETGKQIQMAGNYIVLTTKVNGKLKIVRMTLMVPAAPQS